MNANTSDYTEEEFDKMDEESLFGLWMDTFATFLLTSTNETYEALRLQSERYQEAYDKRYPKSKEAFELKEAERAMKEKAEVIGKIY